MSMPWISLSYKHMHYIDITISANWRAKLKTTPFAYDAHRRTDTLSAELQYLIDTVVASLLFAVHSYYLHAKITENRKLVSWMTRSKLRNLSFLVTKVFPKFILFTYYEILYVYTHCNCNLYIYICACVCATYLSVCYNVIVYSALGSKPVERLETVAKPGE